MLTTRCFLTNKEIKENKEIKKALISILKGNDVLLVNKVTVGKISFFKKITGLEIYFSEKTYDKLVHIKRKGIVIKFLKEVLTLDLIAIENQEKNTEAGTKENTEAGTKENRQKIELTQLTELIKSIKESQLSKDKEIKNLLTDLEKKKKEFIKSVNRLGK